MNDLPKKPRKKEPSELERISNILVLMRESGVQKFKYDGIEVEFDLVLNNSDKNMPTNLDDEVDKLNRIKPDLKDLAENELQDLYWST